MKKKKNIYILFAACAEIVGFPVTQEAAALPLSTLALEHFALAQRDREKE